MKWEKIILNEQETLINIDYYEKVVSLYTTRSIVYKKLLKLIGEPIEKSICNNLIYGAEWKIPFKERKKISKMFNLSNLLMTKERE